MEKVRVPRLYETPLLRDESKFIGYLGNGTIDRVTKKKKGTKTWTYFPQNPAYITGKS